VAFRPTIARGLALSMMYGSDIAVTLNSNINAKNN
jgi:hypothetical protein